MQFAFLAPLFAAALAAVVVPLLVHLVHKERKESVTFPSLMFVQRTPYQHSSRRRIRDVLLFAARCLVIALLVAAFMRPVLARAPQALAAGEGGTEVVVLLDRSLSMRYANRWALASDAVQQRIGRLGRADRMTLVPFDDRAAAVNDATGDVVRLRAALDSVRPADGATRLAPAVALARRLLASSTLPQKEVLVVSDFQRTAWDLGDDVRMPPGTTIVPVDVAKGDVVNRSVRAVEMRRDLAATNERVLVSARLVNSGPAVRGVSARLEVNDRTIETRTVDLPADGGGAVTFAPISVPAEGAPARVVLSEDGLARDDAFHFLLRRAPTIGVLLVEHADASPDRNIFVSRALAIGDQPAFDVRVVRSNRATPADLTGRRLVILNDAGLPSGLGAERLRSFVNGGGGLLNVLGERSGPRSWTPAAGALLPGAIAAPVDRLGERGAVLGYVDRAHPALSIFGGARSGDVSAARFFRYRPLEVEAGVLARFDDGAVALAEHRLGRGRVLTWASGLDGLWNDLPRQAVFLPFLHQVAQYAASYRAQPASHAVGESVDLNDGAAGAGDSTTRRWTAEGPDGRRISVGGEGAPRALELRQAGWYLVRRSGAPNERPRMVAANPAPAELDFATFDPARLTNALAPEGPVTPTSTGADPQQRLVEREREQSMWWYLLVVAALVLLAEGVLASRVSQRRLQPR
jgi:hypothetical protein